MSKLPKPEELKNEFGLTQAEELFCDLYVNGGTGYAGQHCKCYREAFNADNNNLSIKSRRLLAKPYIKERIKSLMELQEKDTETLAVKLQVTETLRAVMEETSTVTFKDRFGLDLSPAPLRAVSVNAAKALMDMFPIKHTQEAKLKIENGESGVVFNVIVPNATSNPQPEQKDE